MIDQSILTTAIKTKVDASAAISALNVTVERGNRINFDAGKCPWMGIYPGNVISKPKTLGAGSSKWANMAEPQVVIQTASYEDDGMGASDELETLIATFLAVIDADLTLGVTGARVVGVSRDYRYVVMDEDGGGSLFMPQAVIKLTMEVRSA